MDKALKFDGGVGTVTSGKSIVSSEGRSGRVGVCGELRPDIFRLVEIFGTGTSGRSIVSRDGRSGRSGGTGGEPRPEILEFIDALLGFDR